MNFFLNNQEVINKKIKSKKVASNSNYNGLLRVIETIDTAVMTLPFALCWFLYYSGRITSPFYNKGNWLVIIIFIILFVMYGRIYEGFFIWLRRISEIAFSQSLAAFFADGTMYLVILLLSKKFVSIIPLLLVFCVQVVLAIKHVLTYYNFGFFIPLKQSGPQ